MLAWCPGEHTWASHIEDDRVQKDGALQPRLVPLRVHEGGVHGPVQKKKKRARCRRRAPAQCRKRAPLCIDTKRLFGPEHGDESAVLIIVLHTSSVLVTVRATKNAKSNSDKEVNCGHFSRIRGSSARSRLLWTGIGGRNNKHRLAIMLASMVRLHPTLILNPQGRQ